MRPTLAIVFLCLFSNQADALNVSCEDVRAYVAEHGKAKALAFAISNGATLHEINLARRCLYAAPKQAS